MRSSTFVAIAGCTAIATAEHKRASLELPKRGLKSCQETYGPGSVQCGNEKSTYCYNPLLGQVRLKWKLRPVSECQC